MAAPTLGSYQQSDWTDVTTAGEVTPSITWSAGDVILVIGMTEDNAVTLGTPTATGLTFSALSGFPTNSASHTKLYAWSATAGSGGSGAVTATAADGASHSRGIAAFVYAGSDGIGTIAVNASSGSTTSISLNKSGANSAVVSVLSDWSATSDVTVSWTPAGFTQRVNYEAVGRATYFLANWPDQGAAGSVTYGFTAGAGTDYSVAAIEILGTGGGGGGRSTKNTLAAPLGTEIGMNWRGGD